MSDHEVTQAEWVALHFANALSESEDLTACYVLSGCSGAAGVDLECTDVTLQDGSGNAVTTPYECEGYRLPTEAEWEYAGRDGTTTAFYNGPITTEYGSDPRANKFAWCFQNSGSTTHAIKGKTPNAWGLYDMSGNVYEWVWDKYDDYSGDVIDPAGPSSGLDRVVRGGSWIDFGSYLRAANRVNYAPGFGFSVLGFRLARTVH